MAESCPSGNRNNLNALSSINRDSELPKQDCTSPSPTETVCLDSLCSTENAPGKSQPNQRHAITPLVGTSQNHLAPLSERLDAIFRNSHSEEKLDKTNFLNELGLEECDEEDSCDREENWEDCTEGDLSEDNQDLDEVRCFTQVIPVTSVLFALGRR